jgi:SAM-dependent methyltransferase
MNLRTATSLFRRGRPRLLWNVARHLDPFYRVTFVASAASAGVLALLASGPRSLEELAVELSPDPATRGALEVWLDLGARLGELEKGPEGYRLAGYLSRALAAAENDDVAALVAEVARFHHRLILETPERTRRGALWNTDEHDALLIARSSRILEPFLFEVLDRTLPASGPVRWLDVGCGAGACLLHAAKRNPDLRAVGIELRPEVAEAARAAVRSAGMEHRITVETGDIRERRGCGGFDVVTLHNAIYYFPLAERTDLLAELSSFLVPGGRLVVTTCCKGGSPGMRVLDLWMSGTAGFGPLPTKKQLVSQLRAAGLVAIEARRAIPGEAYFAFTASRFPVEEGAW